MTLTLWILRDRPGLPADRTLNPWHGQRGDTTFTHVVQAETEEQARQLAGEHAGHEVRPAATWEELKAAVAQMALGEKITSTPAPYPINPWLNPEHTTCEPFTAGAEPAHLLQEDDYR